jgi:hypothetical protein
MLDDEQSRGYTSPMRALQPCFRAHAPGSEAE